MPNDLWGKALLDFQSGSSFQDIVTYSSLDEKDVLPVNHLFRTYDEMPLLEREALNRCHGKVLDIGCGAGSHCLYLQDQGIDVYGLDNSRGAIEVCKKRGVRNTIFSDIMDYSSEKFDILLMLMNGIGIVGTLNGLHRFLDHAKKLIKPGGSILLDSSDIIYMYETEMGHYDITDVKEYYGEIEFEMEYCGERSGTFRWLYVDFDTLNKIATESYFDCQMLAQGEHFDYLAELSPKLQLGAR